MEVDSSMKKWIRAMNAAMSTCVIVTVIRFIVDYADCIILRPEVYEVRSAPWYTAGMIYCAITLAVIVICVVAKAVIKRRYQ